MRGLRALRRFPFTADQHIASPDWETYLSDTAAKILDKQTPQQYVNNEGVLCVACVRGAMFGYAELRMRGACNMRMYHEILIRVPCAGCWRFEAACTSCLATVSPQRSL